MKQFYVLAIGAMLFLGTGCAMNRCSTGGCDGGNCGVSHCDEGSCGIGHARGGCCRGTRSICQNCKSCGSQGCLPDVFSWFRNFRLCGPCGGCFGGWGCGERYYGDWYGTHSSCEPCDSHGNWTGPHSAHLQPGAEVHPVAGHETIIEQPTPAVSKAGYGRSVPHASTPLFPWLRTARYGMPQSQQRY